MPTLPNTAVLFITTDTRVRPYHGRPGVICVSREVIDDLVGLRIKAGVLVMVTTLAVIEQCSGAATLDLRRLRSQSTELSARIETHSRSWSEVGVSADLRSRLPRNSRLVIVGHGRSDRPRISSLN